MLSSIVGITREVARWEIQDGIDFRKLAPKQNNKINNIELHTFFYNQFFRDNFIPTNFSLYHILGYNVFRMRIRISFIKYCDHVVESVVEKVGRSSPKTHYFNKNSANGMCF